MYRSILLAHLFLSLLLVTGSASWAQGPDADRPREPIVGLPCEGCEAVFEGLPRELESQGRIASASAPGEALRIVGTVTDSEGNPASGVIVYAYQTDAEGIYPGRRDSDSAGVSMHGSLRAWVITDANGQYAFDTIRPGSYPNTQIPAHIHMHVIEVGQCTYYVDDILFEDDPLLTPERAKRMSRGRGGSGVVKPVRAENEEGWIVTRDIVLGAGVPGYR